MAQNNEPIEIRVHHVKSAMGILEFSRDEAAVMLISTGYIKNPDSKFLEVYYDRLKELFEDLDQKFKLISEQPDFICDACRDSHSKNYSPLCFSDSLDKKVLIDENRRKNAISKVGSFFADLVVKQGKSGDDKDVAREYGLEVGKVYTSRELMDKFETYNSY